MGPDGGLDPALPARPSRLVRVLAHLGALVPLASVLYAVLTDQLSANPYEDVTRTLGRYALLMLALSLAVTPATWVLERVHWRRAAVSLRPLRRTFGLYAFGYAGLHLFVFAVLDYGLRSDVLVDAVLEKRYALVGLIAFLVLTALAATSTDGSRRRLGRGWTRLHELVYPAAVLVVLHFVWAAKAMTLGRVLWAAAILGLLVVRIPLWLDARRRRRPAQGG